MKALRQTTETHDIYQTPGVAYIDFATGSDKDAYAAIIGDAIRTVKGELQLDVESGIPYFATVFDRADKVNIWKHYVEKKILGYDFVVGISKFNVDVIDNSTLKYDMVVDTIDGEASISAIDPVGGGGGGGGGSMESLVQDGQFYLPVFLRGGVQVYRKLTEYNLDGNVVTELSDVTYVKNSEGIFVREEV